MLIHSIRMVMRNHFLTRTTSWLIILLSFASPPSPAASPGSNQNVSPPHAFVEKSTLPSCNPLAWANPRPTGNDFNATIYVNNQYVAVGNYGTIATSPDAATWTLRASGTTKDLFGVAFGNGTYIVVGDNVALKSPNSTTWTMSPIDPGTYSDITFNGTKFFTVGGYEYDYNSEVNYFTKILSTTNGSSWMPHGFGIKSPLNSIAANGSTLVAVGSYETDYSYPTTDVGAAVFQSPDGGSTWNYYNPGTTELLNEVQYFINQFYAVSNSGGVFTSPDGKIWTYFYTGTTDPLYGVFGSSTQILAVGGYGDTPSVVSSTNGGASWANVTMNWGTAGIPNNMFYDVTFGNGNFLGVGNYGFLGTSSNGTNWTKRGTSVTDSKINTAMWTGTQYILGGDNGGIFTSAGGFNWTKRASNVTSHLNSAIAPAANNLIMVGNDGTILYSSDGITWTKSTNTGTAYDLYSIASNGAGKYVAGGEHYIVKSSDGKNWSNVILPSNYLYNTELRGAAYGNGKFVFVGYSYYNKGIILTSADDGTNWIKRTIGSVLNSIAYNGSLFLAVGYSTNYYGGNNIFSSTDGNIWVPRAANKNHFTSVTWSSAAKQFIAVGYDDNGKAIILTSPDGNAWASRNSITDNELHAVARGPNNIVIAGVKGTILNAQCGVTTPATFPLTIKKFGTGQGTVTTNPAGINCGATCTANFANGAKVTLGVTPATNSIFAGFTGSPGCTNWQVVMDDPKTCNATFTSKLPTIYTYDATNITATSAILNGYVGNNRSTTATVSFDLGTTTAYGTNVPAGSMYGNDYFSVNKAGLLCNTTYNFLAKATNSFGTGMGINKIFKTSTCP